ncbi:glycosyltransferase family A protein [Paracoccus litorisediminis]|uniref:Glycosyltransferase n=1 Tax=Paracoccus litorisediminis TaxID=2006130 RepID=A0A844HFL3_9RHOB|nr:glycosyltransferase [Paracoccus litorisediminis]
MPGGSSPIPASVIVVSRGRPRELQACLAALSRQTHPLFELILVADSPSLGLRPDLAIKRVRFDEPNISVARNAGIAQAAGDIVLFIDDDALAAPRWIERLTQPFEDARVIAATGFTRGPDGLSWQVRAERINASGQGRAIPVTSPTLLGPENGTAISTVGTNCAFRRSALTAIGGFDPSFAYFLDESDVNLRLAARFPEGLTAVIPEAEVIHGLAPGVARAAAGVPSDLQAIGRSAAIFATRHGGDVSWLRHAQRVRLLRHMVAGRLDPLAVGSVLRTLDMGLAEGVGVNAAPSKWAAESPPDFLHFQAAPAAPLFLSGWYWQRRVLRKQAAAAVAKGAAPLILLLTPSFIPHRKMLHSGGWWEQSGGAWGPSQPGDSTVITMRPSARILRERAFFAATQH